MKNNYKILLINPPYIKYSGIKDSGGHAIPLNLAYLAAYVREVSDSYEVKILDAENEGLFYKEILEYIKEWSPDIIGISSPTPAFNHVNNILGEVKKYNSLIITVAGGPHPTAFPEELAANKNIDYVVRGEGEETFAELISALLNEEDVSKIPGLAFKKGGAVYLTEERLLIKDLDSLPLPARDLFDLKKYYQAPTKKVSNYRSTSIMTSRGCPYDCSHCISKLIWRRRVRYRSIDNIMNEIEECIKLYGIREFNFYDDTFTLSKSRVMEFCKKIKEREINIAWICFGRVNIIDEEMLAAMREAGCRKISFGLESGSQIILDNMRKQTTPALGRRAVELAKKAGLDVHASFMLGNIGESRDTVLETIKYAKSLDLDNATFFITAPFPGTDLYTLAKEKGYIKEDINWELFAPITRSEPILIQDNLGKEELVALQKKAFNSFYMRPRYILKKLKKIKTFDDIKTILEGLGVFFRLQRKK